MTKVVQYMGLAVKEIKPLIKDFKPISCGVKGQSALLVELHSEFSPNTFSELTWVWAPSFAM
ncbi:hypothetical protein [Spirosoma linguale]|uniref:Uncharacterized protein n=1 Tax=Spirosoma linguale (strain ATCC 33905 / DSM 74 / LMG 10896 / Claus 1) TaxID=504472 RepID=D2QBW3_SPILD|nr:hypothetical protein Slin_1947 [Spirosoma linguale DSM 74]